ncbi:MAG: stage V sporulation protein AD [Clostridiales bacterium]|nr:stage V sporulation protein AD [Clostridiales bacterium]
MGSRKGKCMVFERPPVLRAAASVVGKKEGEGPLGHCFDVVNEDAYFGEKTWEKAEASLQRTSAGLAMQKAELAPTQVDVVLAGDLINQCTPSTFGLVEFGIPFIGLFGACSTCAEGLAVGAALLNAGYAKTALCVTSSHFSTAERQFRMPLAYGAQRPPTAQWTVTGSGAFVLDAGMPAKSGEICIRAALVGKPVDMGIVDANNMGAAMAPAACDSIQQFLQDMDCTPASFDLIATGDLGALGYGIVKDLLGRDGLVLDNVYDDCGLMIFDRETQEVEAGASGCACSAVVLAGHLLQQLREGILNNVLLVGTGALMSPTSFQQGESIVGIAHCVWLSRQP